MNAIIVSVGDELVLGQTVDTNSAWLSRELAGIGCAVIAHVTVGDSQSAIEQALRDAASRCDLILVSGGIGPTADDLTRHALAAVLKQPLELRQDWLAELEKFFVRRGRPMPELNRIQAMIPRGAELLWNHHGTAAGIRTHLGQTQVVIMPGVPVEMKKMFEQAMLPALRQQAGGAVILSRTLHTFGLGESSVAEKLGDLMDRGRNPSVGTTVSGGIVSLRINARGHSAADAHRELANTERACLAALGDLVFGADDDSLPAVVGKMLAGKHKHVATAESCTGGLLAKLLTDVAGSSNYFTQGWVTYSNDAKHDRLGVPRELIGLYGAVSEPVAAAMARAARRLASADYALAISGIAGPGGATETKPVGTVCIALAEAGGEPAVRTFHFGGDRELIRDRSAKMALALLRYRLLGLTPPF